MTRKRNGLTEALVLNNLFTEHGLSFLHAKYSIVLTSSETGVDNSIKLYQTAKFRTAFADNKINVAQKTVSVLKVRKHCAKRGKCWFSFSHNAFNRYN